MSKLFFKYLSVGIVNTMLHWVVFAWLVYKEDFSQATSNLYAFMGALSYTSGLLADRISLTPILTLITFSAISLIVGFFYSKLIVFKDKK